MDRKDRLDDASDFAAAPAAPPGRPGHTGLGVWHCLARPSGAPCAVVAASIPAGSDRQGVRRRFPSVGRTSRCAQGRRAGTRSLRPRAARCDLGFAAFRRDTTSDAVPCDGRGAEPVGHGPRKPEGARPPDPSQGVGAAPRGHEGRSSSRIPGRCGTRRTGPRNRARSDRRRDARRSPGDVVRDRLPRPQALAGTTSPAPSRFFRAGDRPSRRRAIVRLRPAAAGR